MAKTAKKKKAPDEIEIGTNIEASIEDGKLVLKIDLSEEGEESSTGKSMILAKTNRFEAIEDLGEDAEEVLVNLMVIKKIDKPSKKNKKPKKDEKSGSSKHRRSDDDEDED